MACLFSLHLVLIIEATSKLRCISVVNCCIEEKNNIWNKRETKFASSGNISGLKYLLHKRIFVLCWPLGGWDILTNRFWRRPVWNSNPNWAGSNWKSTSMVSFSLQAHRPPLLERWAWFWRGGGLSISMARLRQRGGRRGLLIRRSSRFQLTFLCTFSRHCHILIEEGQQGRDLK